MTFRTLATMAALTITTTTATASYADPVPTTNHIKTVNLTKVLKSGELASLEVSTNPKAKCIIQVIDTNGENNSPELAPKMADAQGKVSWSWRPQANGTSEIIVHSLSGKALASVETEISVK